MSQATSFVLIRHAPTAAPGRYIGRTDLPAVLPEPEALGPLWDALSGVEHICSSPLIRARQTAGALFPELRAAIEPDLAEQDFGAWENRRCSEVEMPQGLDAAELAAMTPPDGESFFALCGRVGPALERLRAAHEGDTLAVVAHAGVIRAALVHALNAPAAAGIGFEIAPLSLTRITLFPDGGGAVGYVNRLV